MEDTDNEEGKIIKDFKTMPKSHRMPLTQEQIKQRFDERLKILQTACKRYGNSTFFRRRRGARLMQVAFQLKTYYCPITKCGSSTWKRLFDAIRKHSGQTTKKGVAPKKKEASGATVIVFVRNPYSRLLSAYIDKLFGPNTQYWKYIGTYVVANFRSNASDESLRCGHDVTFAEFIRYVIHAQTTGVHRDSHFIPTHDHCHFCQRDFHYVGHLETISEDMPYILNAINSPVNYTKDFDNSTIVTGAMWVFGQMRSKLEACMGLEEACRRLWKKWHIRGIISKSQLFPFSREEMKNMDTDTFVSESLKALERSRDNPSRKGQKSEAMAEAFSSVPLKDRLELQKLLVLDFELFGFESSPTEVFQVSDEQNSGYSYFSPYD
ncbi:hypothetical protein BaRGS_00016973 [Batillaria attramentaria]|uniref:Carbohydrate sulfotransferase n=1 Tax=Batillaria attramentaria TaxID=370345 RepID=A0ABD0KWX1_9CAEN